MERMLLIVSVEVSDVGNEVFLDAVLTVCTTDAALLDTCMEALHSLEVFAVDVGLAKLEFAGHAGSGVEVLGEDAGSQTVFAVVGPLDGLVDGVVLNQWDNGTEGLLMDDVHILTAVVENGGSVEIALRANAMATTEQCGALLDGALYLLGNALEGTLLYQRTHVDGVVLADVAHTDLRHLLDENLGELGLNILLNIDALGIVADLTVVADT